MSVATADLTEYVDKKVTITLNLAEPNADGNTAEELEGTIITVSGSTVMFKPKGKTTAALLESGDIERIEYAEERAKKLGRKTLKIVKFGQARNHLLERHGLTLAAVNALTEKDAYEQHKAIDHEASDLGHVHKDKPEGTEANPDS